jgi:hypothetical protein
MQEKKLSVEQAVMAMAGSFVLISVLLGILWTQWALVFTLFVGANLLQASFTGFCPAAKVFEKLGFRSGCIFSK